MALLQLHHYRSVGKKNLETREQSRKSTQQWESTSPDLSSAKIITVVFSLNWLEGHGIRNDAVALYVEEKIIIQAVISVKMITFAVDKKLINKQPSTYSE